MGVARRTAVRGPARVDPGPGKESVWNYPRPPAVYQARKHLQVLLNQAVVAETRTPLKVVETGHPPLYGFPHRDAKWVHLKDNGRTLHSEWFGTVSFFDVHVAGRHVENAAWTYHDPPPDFAALKDLVVFDPRKVDACLLNGKKVEPEEAWQWGGWASEDVVGPFASNLRSSPG